MAEQGRAFPATLSLGGQNSKYEGPKQGADVLDWTGPSRATVVGIVKGFGAKHPHHPQFELKVVLKDDPNIKWRDAAGNEVPFPPEFRGGGASLSGRKAIAGKDLKGEDLSRNLSDMFASANLYTVEQLEAIRLAQKAGTMEEWQPDVVIANLLGKDIIVDVDATWDDEGKPWSNIGNLLTEAQYQEAAKSQALFRQKRPAQAPAGKMGGVNVGGAGQMMGIPQMGGAGARPGAGPLGPNPAPMMQAQQQVPFQQAQQPQFAPQQQMQQPQFVQQQPQVPNGTQMPQTNILGVANMGGAVPPRLT